MSNILATPKPLWHSKTFWFNFVGLLLKALTLFGGVEGVEVASDVLLAAGIGESAVNIGLRTVTREPIAHEDHPWGTV